MRPGRIDAADGVCAQTHRRQKGGSGKRIDGADGVCAKTRTGAGAGSGKRIDGDTQKKAPNNRIL